MRTSTKAFLIWTVVWCGLVVLAIWKLPAIKWEYPGKDVTFTTSSDSQFVTAKPATIEVASSSFFVIRNQKTSEVVSGIPTTKPLGWIDDEYYTAGPVDLSAGKWVVEVGSGVTVHLKAESDIETVTSKDDESNVWLIFWLFIIGVVIYVIGLAVGSDIKWDE